MHVRVARLAALGFMLSVFACRDSIAPGKEAASASGSSAVVESGIVVRVSPDSSRGWMFFDDQHGAACLEADNCHIARDTSALHFAETSIELATPTAADGDVLMLPAYRGVRLDRITELRYSTYRESPDSGDRLAVMLQLNVDYDLGDAYTAYEGRIVFEPAQGQRGAVPMGQWQRWDARAGRWWGTKTVVRLGGVETLGVCTKASPCSWSQLLATYPNIGIHAANGAIVLQAGANWAGFRGNADSLAVGVNGVVTTYDFGRVFPATEPPHLYARIGDGVVGQAMPADTTYAPGTRVPYSFSARPGHVAPMVVVDDTMAAASGFVVMDKTHSIEVESDTIYTIEGLSDDGKHIVALIKTLLTSSDKVSAYSEMLTYLNARTAAGADPDSLDRANELAWYLAVDLARDSAALIGVDEALKGYVFSQTAGTPWVSASRMGAIPPMSSSAARSPGAQASARPGTSNSAGAVPRFAPPAGAPGAPQQTLITPSHLVSPTEPTVIVYVNGVFNWPGEAEASAARLGNLVLKHQRFSNGWTRIDHVYNARWEVQLAGYDVTSSCVKTAWRDAPIRSALYVSYRYAACNGTSLVRGIITFDLIQALEARIQLLIGWPSGSADVDSLVNFVKIHRNPPYSEHVIIVGHSEGTIIIPHALQALPDVEGHPLNDAPACLASLSLAGAASRDSYDLDDQYKSGFIIQDDIILKVPLAGGWDLLHTAATDSARARAARANWLGETPIWSDLVRLWERYKLHSIDNTYLKDPTSQEQIIGRLVQLHKECTQGDLVVTPHHVDAPAGTMFTLTPKLTNQNGRELHGRWMRNSAWDEGPFVEIDTNLFLARTPREFDQTLYYYTPWTYDIVAINTPIAKIEGTTITEMHASWWEIYAESNGGALCPCGIEDQVPTIQWDGGENSCTQYVTYYGVSGWAGPSYRTWVRRCNRGYLVTPGTVTEPVVASQVLAFRWRWTFTNGGVTYEQYEPDVWCWDASRCLASVNVWGYDRNNVNIATSGPVAPPTGGSGASSFLAAPQLPPLSEPSKSTAARDAARAKAVQAAQSRLRRTS